MQLPTFAHALARAHRLKMLIERERRTASRGDVRILRLQSLLLRVQHRLAQATSRVDPAPMFATYRPSH